MTPTHDVLIHRIAQSPVSGDEDPKKILVVYPEHMDTDLPPGGLRFAYRLNTFKFLNENCRFVRAIGGMRLHGLIIEEGVTMTAHTDMEYFLTRLYTDTPDIMLMSVEQAKMFRRVVESKLYSLESSGRYTAYLETYMRNVLSRITTHPA